MKTAKLIFRLNRSTVIFPTVAMLVCIFFSCREEEVELEKYTVSTVAGSGKAGSADGSASTAQFDHPFSIAMDAQGVLYVADYQNYKIRIVSTDGSVSTLAGGVQGTADGTGANAQFKFPKSIVVDSQGNIFVGDVTRIRKISPAGEVSSFAGAIAPGYQDGTGSNAMFNYVNALAIDRQDIIYVVDTSYPAARIRMVTPEGVVSTFIDNSKFLGGIAIDEDGNLFVTEPQWSDKHINKITPSKSVTLLAKMPAGNDILINSVTGQMFTTGYFGAYQVIYEVSSKGEYSIVAGSKMGFADGAGQTARFYNPAGLAADLQGNIYVADSGNQRIRKINKIQ